MRARTDGRWTMDDDEDDDASVCPFVRQRGARVGRFGTSRSFVAERNGTERAGRVGEDVVVVVSSGLLVFKSKSNSFLRCGDERTNER